MSSRQLQKRSWDIATSFFLKCNIIDKYGIPIIDYTTLSHHYQIASLLSQIQDVDASAKNWKAGFARLQENSKKNQEN